MTLSVSNGSFSYGQRQVLKNISFTVETGEVLAILGPNGIGKTTLLRCTMGLLKWKSGETSIDGQPLSSYSDSLLWKKIAYVPQARNSMSNTSVMDMVLLGRSSHLGLFQQPGKEDLRLAKEALAYVGMERLADKNCSRISGGELQMVLIARALCTQPEMLVLDEPESNLDFRNQLLVLQTIARLSKENGIAAIVNTHYPVHALQVSDKALILNDDLTSIHGRTVDLVNGDNLTSAFHVDVRIGENWYEGKSYKSVIPIRIMD